MERAVGVRRLVLLRQPFGRYVVVTIKRIRGRALHERRQALFEREPLCRRCSDQGRVRAATKADHIVALVNGGSDTEDNLQPLCDDCHDAKTNDDLGRKPEIGVDGWPVG